MLISQFLIMLVKEALLSLGRFIFVKRGIHFFQFPHPPRDSPFIMLEYGVTDPTNGMTSTIM